jgi:hypothetical protein
MDTFAMLQTLRVLSLGLLMAPIPLTYRLLFIYAIDAIDCNRFWHPIPCKSFEYQMNDKIVDTVTYIAIVGFLMYKYPSAANFLLLGMLLWRMVGIVRLNNTRDAQHLIWHPDLVREFSLVLAAMYDGWINPTPTNFAIVLPVIAIVKWNFEKGLHGGQKYTTPL